MPNVEPGPVLTGSFVSDHRLGEPTGWALIRPPGETGGLLGWSMGGYGALRLATDLGPARVAAVVAASPAVWRDAADAGPSGFASEAEYERYSVMGRQERLAGIPVRVDCGTGDPLYREVEAYVDGFPDDAELTSTFEPGAHAGAFWRRMLPAQLEFLGARLP